MKRVGGLKRQVSTGKKLPRFAGWTNPRSDLLATIRQAVLPMLELQADCYARAIRPAYARRSKACIF